MVKVNGKRLRDDPCKTTDKLVELTIPLTEEGFEIYISAQSLSLYIDKIGVDSENFAWSCYTEDNSEGYMLRSWAGIELHSINLNEAEIYIMHDNSLEIDCYCKAFYNDKTYYAVVTFTANSEWKTVKNYVNAVDSIMPIIDKMFKGKKDIDTIIEEEN